MQEQPATANALLSGTLHIYVAFDWGDEIDLEKARKLVPSSFQALPRRRRTPTSFSYRPPPLHMRLAPVTLALAELGKVEAAAGLTVFDFAAVSIGLHVPVNLPADCWLRLAGSLADPVVNVVLAARAALNPLYEALQPAIRDPSWQDDFSEEYFVFQLPPEACGVAAEASWLGGMVHLESGPLSNEEIQEAIKLKLSYSPGDLFVPDWAAAVLVDQDCDETLQAIEFANLQLLEYRHIDQRLDQNLAAAQRTISPM